MGSEMCIRDRYSCVCIHVCIFMCVCMKYPRMTCYFKGGLKYHLDHRWHYCEGKHEMHSKAAGSTGSRYFTTGKVAPSMRCIGTHTVCIHVCIFMRGYEVSSDDMLLERGLEITGCVCATSNAT